MRVKIAEPEDIRSGNDAVRKLKEWLNNYATAQPGRENGQEFLLRKAWVEKEKDGWYATFAPPVRVPEGQKR